MAEQSRRRNASGLVRVGRWLKLVAFGFLGLALLVGCLFVLPRDALAWLATRTGGFVNERTGMIGPVMLVVLALTVGIPLLVLSWIVTWLGNRSGPSR